MRKIPVISVALVLLALLHPESGSSQNARPFSIDDIFDFQSLSDPQMSPDGTRVLYVRSRRDLQENVQNTEIWMAPAGGGTPLQLTHHPKSDSSPRWSPDGKWIAFLSNRDGRNQVWIMSASGGEAFASTSQKDGVTGFEWAPDGRRIAFTGLEPRDEKLEKQIDERWLPRVVDHDYRYAALWVADLESKKATQITKGKFQVNSFDWSPDGRWLAFSAASTPDLADSDTSEIYVVSAAGGEIRRVAGFRSADTNPNWSPDGKRILFASRGDKTTGAANTDLYMVDATGGTPENLTSGFDESARFVDWSPKDGAVFFMASQRTYRDLFVAPARRVTSGREVYDGFSFDREFNKVAFIRESPMEPPELYVAENLSFETARKLTDSNPQLKGIALGRQEVVRWKNSAGQEVEGVLVKPVGYREGIRSPLLLVIHGGPSGVDADGFNLTKSAYPVQVFAGRGYAVFSVNYRGSSGYGEKWRQGNVGSLGANEFDDIESGIDAMIERGIADGDRLGFMGWSYGGHMTYYAVTHSDRFKAASAGAGATDMISMYAQTDLPGFYSKTYFGFPPWENFDFYIEHSSFFKVADVKTPTLIQYGEKDERVPLPQGLEFYRALKERGVPAMLVIYPGQPHGVREPRYQKDMFQRNLDWFERYLK